MRWRGSPRLRQKPSAIFSATSTEVDPLSEKNTCVERRRRDLDQAARQRLGRLVREAGEDDLIERVAPARSMAATMCG